MRRRLTRPHQNLENFGAAVDVVEGDVVSGWQDKQQTAIASVTPAGALAEMNRRMAQPGTAKQ